MPLTHKGETIKEHMEAEYGAEKGERVFYASKNAGTISGVDDANTSEVPASSNVAAPGPVGGPLGPVFTVGPDGRYVIG